MRNTAPSLPMVVLSAALAFSAALLPACAGGGRQARDAERPWTTIDETYAPRDPVEEFIKNDASVRGALPVEIRNYGHDPAILARFKGRQFARPNPSVLAMFFKGLDDWKLLDIRYKTEKEREAQRTVLYIFVDRQWRVGDNGVLLK